MLLRFNSNLPAMGSYQALEKNSNNLAQSVERLSTGYRINRAADDPAGLSIAERLAAQITGLTQANNNAQHGVTLFQTADESLASTQAVLSRMYELALNASNGDLTNTDRVDIQTEINSLISEADRIAGTTAYNYRKLLNGTANALISTNNPNAIAGLAVGDTGQGGVFSIVINATNAGAQQVQRSSIFTTDGSTTAIASTLLNSIASFSGMFATPQEVQLWGNSKSATVTLYGTDTLDQAMGKISLAVANPDVETDLGMEGAISWSSAPNLARVITSGANSGSVEVSSAIPGSLGEITFSGDENLLTAFGFTDVVSSQEATYSLNVTETNSSASYTQTIKGNRANQLVPGVDVVFDPTTDLSVQANSGGRPSLTTAAGTESFYMAVNPYPLKFQVTLGNELDVKRLNDMTSQSLGVDKIDVVGTDKAERSVTIIQNAMNEVSNERARVGAFENEYTRTMSRLNGIKYNTQQAEDVIRNTDMAQEMIKYTQSQILTNTSAAMLAQANIMPKSIWDILFS